jgi:transcriptional regulator
MAGSDLFTGTLDLLILKTLSWQSMHGYAVGRWLRETSRESLQVDEGALYPALHRLHGKGYLEAEWGLTDTGRKAKFYKITRAGRRHLARQSENWSRHANAVHLILGATPA